MDLERDLDSDTDAERIYKSGTGFVPTLYKIFNFWIAGVLDKIALLLSFVLSAYVFFSFMGFPSPYNIWKGGTADRHLAALENLHKKAQKKSLSTNELKKIRKIEAYFNESDGTSKKATQLIWDITKKNKGPTSPHHT